MSAQTYSVMSNRLWDCWMGEEDAEKLRDELEVLVRSTSGAERDAYVVLLVEVGAAMLHNLSE